MASFFLSRIDAVIDPKESDFIASDGEQAHFATKICGQVAISSAKIAYKIYEDIFENEQFTKPGASPQRLLWASTSPKDPTYSDVKYIEALIGPNTVNTISPETLEAYRDHGDPSNLLEVEVEQALDINKPLAEAYLLKEELRLLWMQKDKATAELYLVSWVMRAWAKKTTKLNKFGNTVMAFRNMILNYYDHPISTGKLEGINNKKKQ